MYTRRHCTHTLSLLSLPLSAFSSDCLSLFLSFSLPLSPHLSLTLCPLLSLARCRARSLFLSFSLSLFLSQQERDQLQAELDRYYKLPNPVGVGMALEETTSKLDTGRTHRMIRVTDLVPAMAAALSGAVRVGDVLVAIDGQGTDTMDLEGVRERVVGPRGSCVVFKFVRGAAGVPLLDGSGAGVEFSVLLKRGAWGPEHAVACLAACSRACLPACLCQTHLHAPAQAQRLVLRMLACMRWDVRKACVAESCRMDLVHARVSQARTMVARTSEKQLHKQRRWSHRRTGTWRTCTAGRSQVPCPHRRSSAAPCSRLLQRARRAPKTHRCRPPRLTSVWWSRACDR